MKRSIMAAVTVGLVCGVAIAWWWRAHPTWEFEKETIGFWEDTLKTDYEEEGFEVSQVSLIRESPRKLTGWIKFRHKKLPAAFPAMSRDCTVTMSDLDGSVMRGCN